MRHRRAIFALILKELRELGPLWLVVLVSVYTEALVLGGGLYPVSGTLYGLGALALGAMSIGHEYRHSTLTTLLVQPIHRWHVLAVKIGVLAVLLGGLGTVTWTEWSLSVQPFWSARAPRGMGYGVWLLPLACALFLAPWFTMLCRSELAGMVFAIAVPALLLFCGHLAAILTYGMAPHAAPAVVAMQSRVVWIGMAAACAVGAVGIVRSFLRLQVMERRDLEIWFPAWLRARAATGSGAKRRVRNPYWALVRKELRLQQVPIGLACFFALGWMALWPWRGVMESRIDIDPVIAALTTLYIGVVVLLIASIASADERQLGTVAFQTIVPIAAWRQWAVKLIVVCGLTAALAVGLPQLLLAVSPGWWLSTRDLWLGITALSLIGLYVSTLNTSAIRSFLMSIGVIVVGAYTLVFVASQIWRLSRGIVSGLVAAWGQPMMAGGSVPSVPGGWLALWWAVMALLALLLLRFSMVNHLSFERGGRKVRRQIGWIVALVLILIIGQMAASWFRMSGPLWRQSQARSRSL